MSNSPRIQSDRFRCPECGNRNECRMCVLTDDAERVAEYRRMYCMDCKNTNYAQLFVSPARRRDLPDSEQPQDFNGPRAWSGVRTDYVRDE